MKSLRVYLIEKDISVTKFAAAIGITQSYLSSLLNKKCSPSLKLLKTIHDATGIDYKELIES